MSDPVILPCPSCGTLNRVPRERFGDVPLCAECGTRLLGGEPAELTEATFDRVLVHSGLPVVVDFWAPWCGPCRTMAPWFAEAAERLAGRAILAKLDTQAWPGPASRFGIQSIPTLIVFEGGTEVARQSGALQADEIERWVGEHL